MLEAAGWSALATGTLLIGMWLAFRGLVNLYWTGLLMAFGAGAIVSAVAYQLLPGRSSMATDGTGLRLPASPAARSSSTSATAGWTASAAASAWTRRAQ